MKIRALKSFEGIRDLERTKKIGKDVFPKEGDIWEVSEERANFLKDHGVVEIVEEENKVDIIENEFEVRSKEAKELVNEKIEKIQEIIKPKKSKKKNNKKK